MHLNVTVKYTPHVMHFSHFYFLNRKNKDFRIKKIKHFRKKQLKKEAGIPQFYWTRQYRHLSEARKTFVSVAEQEKPLYQKTYTEQIPPAGTAL